jgi:hypothetical protein
MADATAQATALRAQLAATVAQQVAQYAQNLATVVQSNPHGEVLALLDRPDVAQSLAQSLAAARSQALAALQQAWAATGADPASPVLASLAQDVQRAYADAPGVIREAAIRAWHSVPQQSFTVGVSTPGTNPAYQTALQRAQAIRDALNGPAQALALRNGLSVIVAGSSGRTEATLAEAMARPDAHLLGKRWVASMDGKDPKSCVWCRRLHGAVVPLSAQFPHPAQIGGHKPPKPYMGRLDGPELHPHCLPGDTRVLAEGITGAVARVFDGEVVVISTLTGKHLSITPNHPVLTGRGWVPAGEITEADHVVSTVSGQRPSAADNDDEDVPPLIEDVAVAFLGTSQVTPVEVPVAAKDFHGDGTGSEVCVVGAYRSLLTDLKSPVSQHLHHHDFPAANAQSALLPGECPSRLGLKALVCTAFGGMRSSSSGLPLRWRKPALGDNLLLAHSAEGDPLTDQELCEGSARDSLLLGERLDTFAGQVSLDQVARVSRRPFTGHVYNLQTRSGWYIGSGIVVHNCQCHLEIVPLAEAPVPAPAPVPPEELPDMVSSEDIAAMPEERYQSMRHFLSSALHELAQVIRAILGIGAGS